MLDSSSRRLKDRYPREDRYSQIERIRLKELNNTAKLVEAKKTINSELNVLIEREIKDLLVYSFKDRGLVHFDAIQTSIINSHPTPTYRLALIIDYCRRLGIDVDKGVWGLKLYFLKKEIHDRTDPNVLYKISCGGK